MELALEIRLEVWSIERHAGGGVAGLCGALQGLLMGVGR